MSLEVNRTEISSSYIISERLRYLYTWIKFANAYYHFLAVIFGIPGFLSMETNIYNTRNVLIYKQVLSYSYFSSKGDFV